MTGIKSFHGDVDIRAESVGYQIASLRALSRAFPKHTPFFHELEHNVNFRDVSHVIFLFEKARSFLSTEENVEQAKRAILRMVLSSKGQRRCKFSGKILSLSFLSRMLDKIFKSIRKSGRQKRTPGKPQSGNRKSENGRRIQKSETRKSENAKRKGEGATNVKRRIQENGRSVKKGSEKLKPGKFEIPFSELTPAERYIKWTIPAKNIPLFVHQFPQKLQHKLQQKLEQRKQVSEIDSLFQDESAEKEGGKLSAKFLNATALSAAVILSTEIDALFISMDSTDRNVTQGDRQKAAENSEPVEFYKGMNEFFETIPDGDDSTTSSSTKMGDTNNSTSKAANTALEAQVERVLDRLKRKSKDMVPVMPPSDKGKGRGKSKDFDKGKGKDFDKGKGKNFDKGNGKNFDKGKDKDGGKGKGKDSDKGKGKDGGKAKDGTEKGGGKDGGKAKDGSEKGCGKDGGKAKNGTEKGAGNNGGYDEARKVKYLKDLIENNILNGYEEYSSESLKKYERPEPLMNKVADLYSFDADKLWRKLDERKAHNSANDLNESEKRHFNSWFWTRSCFFPVEQYKIKLGEHYRKPQSDLSNPQPKSGAFNTRPQSEGQRIGAFSGIEQQLPGAATGGRISGGQHPGSSSGGQQPVSLAGRKIFNPLAGTSRGGGIINPFKCPETTNGENKPFAAKRARDIRCDSNRNFSQDDSKPHDYRQNDSSSQAFKLSDYISFDFSSQGGSHQQGCFNSPNPQGGFNNSSYQQGSLSTSYQTWDVTEQVQAFRMRERESLKGYKFPMERPQEFSDLHESIRLDRQFRMVGTLEDYSETGKVVFLRSSYYATQANPDQRLICPITKFKHVIRERILAEYPNDPEFYCLREKVAGGEANFHFSDVELTAIRHYLGRRVAETIVTGKKLYMVYALQKDKVKPGKFLASNVELVEEEHIASILPTGFWRVPSESPKKLGEDSNNSKGPYWKASSPGAADVNGATPLNGGQRSNFLSRDNSFSRGGGSESQGTSRFSNYNGTHASSHPSGGPSGGVTSFKRPVAGAEYSGSESSTADLLAIGDMIRPPSSSLKGEGKSGKEQKDRYDRNINNRNGDYRCDTSNDRGGSYNDKNDRGGGSDNNRNGDYDRYNDRRDRNDNMNDRGSRYDKDRGGRYDDKRNGRYDNHRGVGPDNSRDERLDTTYGRGDHRDRRYNDDNNDRLKSRRIDDRSSPNLRSSPNQSDALLQQNSELAAQNAALMNLVQNMLGIPAPDPASLLGAMPNMGMPSTPNMQMASPNIIQNFKSSKGNGRNHDKGAGGGKGRS